MANALRMILAALGTILVGIAPAGGENQVAIVHYSQLKAAKLEGTTTNISFRPVVGRPEETPIIRLTNELFVKRQITLRILDLTEPEYDLYIDNNPDGTKKVTVPPPTDGRVEIPDSRVYLAGARKKAELESGIAITLSRGLILPGYRDYFARVLAGASQAAKLYEQATDDDGRLCAAVMKGVVRWIEGLNKGDEKFRTVNVFVVPAGRSFALPGAGLLPPPDGFTQVVIDHADGIQTARSDLVRRVKNAICSQDALRAITPIDFRLVAGQPLVAGKKVTFRVGLTNWTDRVVTGKVKLNVPGGWKVRGISSGVKMPGYSKTAEAKFEVVVPKTAKPNADVSADVDLKVGGVPLRLLARVERK